MWPAHRQGPWPQSAGHGDAKGLFYTTSGAGTGLPNGAEIFAISVSGAKVTTRDIGPTHGGDCASLALWPHGTLYSMSGPSSGPRGWRPSTRRLETPTCSACLSPGSLSWPWPSAATGLCTPLAIATPIRRPSSALPAQTHLQLTLQGQ